MKLILFAATTDVLNFHNGIVDSFVAFMEFPQSFSDSHIPVVQILVSMDEYFVEQNEWNNWSFTVNRKK